MPQLFVVGCRGKGPTEPVGSKPFEILGEGALGDRATIHDLPLGQMTFERQAQHFTDL